MNVELLTVGTELLLGDVVDTNAAWLGRRVADAGLDLTRTTTVGDVLAEMVSAIQEAAGRADAVILTGGLGPTPDDLTRQALAQAAGVELRRDEELAAGLRERYRRLGRAMAEANLRQADVPVGASALANPRGSAPGLRCVVAGCPVYALPGVPHEMQAMVEASVLPDLLARAGRRSAILSRTLRTAGVYESALAERVAAVDAQLRAAGNPTLAYLPSRGQVRLRLTAHAPSVEAARELIEPVERQLRALLGEDVYGADEDSLDGVVHDLLARAGATVATAESLTGGLLGAALTERPGSSATYRGGVVAYATELKHTLCGVPAALLAERGPVDPDVATAMALGVRERLDATYGLALTGVAGPQPQVRPVGTVHVGLAGPDGAAAATLALSGDREPIRTYAVVAALDTLRRRLLRAAPPLPGGGG